MNSKIKKIGASRRHRVRQNAGAFGTAVLSPVFKIYQEYKLKTSDLVAGAGFAPISGVLRRVRKLASKVAKYGEK